MKTSLLPFAGKLALVLALFAAPVLRADPFVFDVSLNTASLVGASNSPFFLDFQLNKGDGSLDNTVLLSGFQFNGGNATGTPSYFGNATGDLTGTVSLAGSSASPYNEFFQGFSAGTTFINFSVTVSQNSPGATPDGFAISILDSQAGNPQIYTTSPDTLSLVTLNIGAANSLSDVKVFTSTSPAGVVAAVPEPAATAALLGVIGLAAVAFIRARRYGTFARFGLQAVTG